MTHSEEESTALALLSQLSVSPFSQPQNTLSALKRLKHELIGHEQKKELFVRLGIVPPLVRILEGTGNADEVWSNARLEAGIAVGSLAYGGENYISHLFDSQALPPLIASLDPASSPPKLVLSSLRTLNTILDTSAFSATCPSYTIAAALYTPEVLNSLYKILSQQSPAALVQQQISLTASLIAKSCGRYAPGSSDNSGCHSTHQKLLVEAGVLGALSARLGGHIVAEKSIPKNPKNTHSSDIPPPAPPGAKLAPILDAISVIIKDSRLRSLEFLFSPSIIAIFPLPTNEPSPPDATSNKPGEGAVGSTSSITLPQPQLASNSIIQPPDLLITPSAFPPLSAASVVSPTSSGHVPESSMHGNSNFPALSPFYNPQAGVADSQAALLGGGHTGDDSESSTGGDTPLRQRAEIADLEDRITRSAALTATEGGSNRSEVDLEIEESPILPWLISQVRSGDSITRLMAISVLTNLFKVELVSKKLVQLLILLVLPVLVRLLTEEGKESRINAGVGSVDSETWTSWTIQEKAPAILARLVMDSTEMQKAAVDAGAIKKLAAILKKANELPSSTMNGHQNGNSHDSNHTEKPGSNLEITHRMKVKEGGLKCLASLALFKDEYRKAIIETGVVPILVSSMKPLEPIPTPVPQQNTVGQGNPPAVLTAACGAIRALSRSVSILRTSLIDAGIALPLFALLRHDDIEVRIASTAAVCNLVLDFSPMRRPILEAGVLDVLCSHAKSENAALRLNALWALKHLVLEAETEVKRKCFEGLGVDWLLGVISRDVYGDEDGEDDEMAESEDGNGDDTEGERTRPWARRFPPKATAVMAQLERRERDDSLRRRKEDIALQEQGLDFLRNWICGKDRNLMIDHLFESMGKDRVFEILEDKLKHKRYVRRGELISESPPGEIVTSVVYILVHLATGSLPHKRALVQRVDLLRTLSALWNHRLPHVRSGLAWVVINLTWRDEHEDIEEVCTRARELIRLGFDKSLESMSQDSELDIRERVKTARHQLNIVGPVD
ncbi:ARM repeat-containing protein [Choiromyces venosus 120613-1]|uniref:ARM repeat-containing protein n=1 Tax=Choiromyces venosus 120613-1 TaxID=1336337 RepID=A0A3N4JZE3_9PEZI|nr:ARM repeat-containing protein [Choiromyces venosus 120613-1]